VKRRMVTSLHRWPRRGYGSVVGGAHGCGAVGLWRRRSGGNHFGATRSDSAWHACRFALEGFWPVAGWAAYLQCWAVQSGAGPHSLVG
jgi:hypothetical protein